MSLTCISSLLSTWKVQWNLPRADIFNSGHISKADSKSGTVTSQTLINLRLQSGHLSKAGTIFGPVSVRFKDVSLYMLLQRLLIRTTDVPCVQLYNTTHTGCQSHYLLWCQLHRQRRMIFCGWCQSGQIRQMFDTWHFCVLKWVLIFCKKKTERTFTPIWSLRAICQLNFSIEVTIFNCDHLNFWKHNWKSYNSTQRSAKSNFMGPRFLLISQVWRPVNLMC